MTFGSHRNSTNKFPYYYAEMRFSVSAYHGAFSINACFWWQRSAPSHGLVLYPVFFPSIIINISVTNGKYIKALSIFGSEAGNFAV